VLSPLIWSSLITPASDELVTKRVRRGSILAFSSSNITCIVRKCSARLCAEVGAQPMRIGRLSRLDQCARDSGRFDGPPTERRRWRSITKQDVVCLIVSPSRSPEYRTMASPRPHYSMRETENRYTMVEVGIGHHYDPPTRALASRKLTSGPAVVKVCQRRE